MEHPIYLIYAEDNKNTAWLYTRKLEKMGFSVKVARDGTQAWELLQTEVPDILLLDIEMPGKDGLEVVELFRQTNRQTPVVIFSNYLYTGREIKAIQLGADDCISKKNGSDFLIAKLKSIYERVTRGEKNPQIYNLSRHTKYNAIAGTLTIDNKRIKLKDTEAQIMHLLCVKFQELSSYDYLIEGVWGKNFASKQALLRKYISELNKKLEADPSLSLKVCRNMGYRLYCEDFLQE
ncbi:response regulator transcription factor [Butyricimonas sp.]|uniref:response regulator transcription factor n=1 Tax=Butyricimonas sp. TaxID=1969738 RepID=UPI0025BF97AC|nr:response regulator transcription factor [Butyricimonas sp.]